MHINELESRVRERARVQLGYDIRNATTDEALATMQEIAPQVIKEANLSVDQLHDLLAEEVVENVLRHAELIRDDNDPSK